MTDGEKEYRAAREELTADLTVLSLLRAEIPLSRDVLTLMDAAGNAQAAVKRSVGRYINAANALGVSPKL